MKPYYYTVEQTHTLRVYNNSDQAWKALTPAMHKKGWRIGCYGGFDNAIIKRTQKASRPKPTVNPQ